MATAEYAATIRATTDPGADAGAANAIGGGVSNLATLATDAGTLANHATNGIIALLGSGSGSGPITFSATTLQFSGDANTSTTVSQANANALIGYINAVLADAKAATTSLPTSDVSVYIGTVANVGTKRKLRAALDAIYRVIAGSHLLTD